jgi:hypothetical protein
MPNVDSATSPEAPRDLVQDLQKPGLRTPRIWRSWVYSSLVCCRRTVHLPSRRCGHPHHSFGLRASGCCFVFGLMGFGFCVKKGRLLQCSVPVRGCWAEWDRVVGSLLLMVARRRLLLAPVAEHRKRMVVFRGLIRHFLRRRPVVRRTALLWASSLDRTAMPIQGRLSGCCG